MLPHLTSDWLSIFFQRPSPLPCAFQSKRSHIPGSSFCSSRVLLLNPPVFHQACCVWIQPLLITRCFWINLPFITRVQGRHSRKRTLTFSPFLLIPSRSAGAPPPKDLACVSNQSRIQIYRYPVCHLSPSLIEIHGPACKQTDRNRLVKSSPALLAS